MNRLTAAQILQLWEDGRDLHPLDRALAILAAGFPGEDWEALADLPIGQRDGRLLRLHQATFGPRLASRAGCPNCSTMVDFDVEISMLLEGNGPTPEVDEAFDWIASNGSVLRYRLPNSRDVAAASGLPEAGTARRTLAERCLLHGDALSLTPEDLDCLSLQMAEHDPLADINFELACPACRKPWQAPLDIPAYFWQEINAEVRRLASEVDALARAYGWREADILAMSARRRYMYVQLAT